MACLRETPPDGRLGTVSCDEESCLFRRITSFSGETIIGTTSEADCLLQLRLRAGAAEDAGTGRVDHQTGFVAWRDGPIRKYEGRSERVPEAGGATAEGAGGSEDKVEWDIDANLPVYTQDYIRLLKPENADEFGYYRRNGRVQQVNARSAHPDIIGYRNTRTGDVFHPSEIVIVRKGHCPATDDGEHEWSNQYVDNRLFQSYCIRCGVDRALSDATDEESEVEHKRDDFFIDFSAREVFQRVFGDVSNTQWQFLKEWVRDGCPGSKAKGD